MKRLTIDSTGAVVSATRFVAQRGITSPPSVSPLQRLDRILKGEEPPHICIVRDRPGIGDILMTTPTVRAIKEKYNCTIDYATNPDYLGGALVQVLATNPHIDNIIDFRTMDKTAYNTVVNLSCPCVSHEVPGAQPIHRIDLFARGAGLPIPIVDPTLEYSVLENEKEWARNWLSARNLLQHKFIVVQANSSTRRRDMPQLVLQKALMKILRHFKGTYKAIIVLHDQNKAPEINWNLEGTVLLHNHSVRQITAMIDLADLVVTPDSACLHLASALHKKTVALFGPTDPRARINYHPEAVAICPGAELSCSFCWYAPCHNGLTCWKRITDDMISELAIALIEEKKITPKPPSPYIHFGSLISSPIRSLPGQPFEVI